MTEKEIYFGFWEKSTWGCYSHPEVYFYKENEETFDIDVSSILNEISDNTFSTLEEKSHDELRDMLASIGFVHKPNFKEDFEVSDNKIPPFPEF